MKKIILLIPLTLMIFLANAQVMIVAEFDDAQQLEKEVSIQPIASVVDDLGHVYKTGSFTGTKDFDPGPKTYELTATGESDVFITKSNAAGELLWAKQLGGANADEGWSIALDNSDNLFITGSFSGEADFDPGASSYMIASVEDSKDIFVTKLDEEGNFIWVKQFGSEGADAGMGITTDGFDNIYLTGYFSGTVDFDPGTSHYDITSKGGEDIFITRLNYYGEFDWVMPFGGTANDRGVTIEIEHPLADTIDIKTSGIFGASVDFDHGTGTHELTSEEKEGIFVQTIRQFEAVAFDNTFGDHFKIHPIPTSGPLSVEFGKIYEKIISIIRDPDGEVIATQEDVNTDKIELTIEGPTAIYQIEFRTNESQFYTIKIMKRTLTQ